MLENNVIQHIIIDPAGQLAKLKTRHRWNGRGTTRPLLVAVSSRGSTAGQLKPGTKDSENKKGNEKEKKENGKLYKKNKKKRKKEGKKMKQNATKRRVKYLCIKRIHYKYNVFLRPVKLSF